MLESIAKLQTVMSHASHYLLTASKAFYKPSMNTQWFDLVSSLLSPTYDLSHVFVSLVP